MLIGTPALYPWWASSPAPRDAASRRLASHFCSTVEIRIATWMVPAPSTSVLCECFRLKYLSLCLLSSTTDHRKMGVCMAAVASKTDAWRRKQLTYIILFFGMQVLLRLPDPLPGHRERDRHAWRQRFRRRPRRGANGSLI